MKLHTFTFAFIWFSYFKKRNAALPIVKLLVKLLDKHFPSWVSKVLFHQT